MKTNVIGSILIVAYVNLLPYACRLPRGIEWAAQYLPDEGHLLAGLLFFGAFASLPAVPLVVTFLLRKHVPIAFWVSAALATVLLVLAHHDYDLASDAQAAIGLIVIPVAILLPTALVALVAGVIEWQVRGRRNAGNTNPP